MHLPDRLASLDARPFDRLQADFPRGDSAVLLLIVVGSGEPPGVVLTRRSADLRTDPGFVAFPGGRLEPGETAHDAARRECEEEVGISADTVTIHGRLDDTWNGAGFRITPIVASVIGPLELAPQISEVSAAAVVPLASLVDDRHHETVVKRIDGFDFHDDVIEFAHADELAWRLYGPTADIARDIAAWLRGDDRRRITRRQAELDHFASTRWSTET